LAEYFYNLADGARVSASVRLGSLLLNPLCIFAGKPQKYVGLGTFRPPRVVLWWSVPPTHTITTWQIVDWAVQKLRTQWGKAALP